MSKDEKAGYYDAGGIETIDIIKAKLTHEQFEGYLMGNAIKYLCRANWKEEYRPRDIEKALNYTRWLKDSLWETDAAERATTALKKAWGG